MRSDLKVQLLVECVAFLFAIEFCSFLYFGVCFFFSLIRNDEQDRSFASFVFIFRRSYLFAVHAFIVCIDVCIFVVVVALLLFVIRTDCIWFVLSHVYTEAESLHRIAP